MSLTGFTGEQIEIQETEIIRYEIPKKVYNFSIEGTENYYVGEQGVLVHNDEGCPSGNEVKKKNTKVNKPGLEAGVNKGKVVNPMDNSFEKLENVIDPVEADHIYPKNAIDKDFSVKMKELTLSQKKAVYENPKNLQYLRKTHNASKGAKTITSNKPWEKWNGKNINPNYKKRLEIK